MLIDVVTGEVPRYNEARASILAAHQVRIDHAHRSMERVQRIKGDTEATVGRVVDGEIARIGSTISALGRSLDVVA